MFLYETGKNTFEFDGFLSVYLVLVYLFFNFMIGSGGRVEGVEGLSKKEKELLDTGNNVVVVGRKEVGRGG